MDTGTTLSFLMLLSIQKMMVQNWYAMSYYLTMATSTEGFGSINWWGFSQALDLFSLSSSLASNEITKQGLCTM